MVQVVDADLVVAHQAQEQVGATLVAEREGAPFDLLSDPLEHGLQGGAAVVLRESRPPGDLVSHLGVVALDVASKLRSNWSGSLIVWYSWD